MILYWFGKKILIIGILTFNRDSAFRYWINSMNIFKLLTISGFLYKSSHLLGMNATVWLYTCIICPMQWTIFKIKTKKLRNAQKILGHPRHRHKENMDILTMKIKIFVYCILLLIWIVCTIAFRTPNTIY